MIVLLLVGCRGPELASPACESSSTVVSASDSTLGYSADDLFSAATSSSWLQGLDWDSRFSPANDKPFQPVFQVISLDGEVQMIERTGGSCEDALLARVTVSLALSQDGAFSTQSTAWLGGSPASPEIRYGYESSHERFPLDEEEMRIFTDTRGASYGAEYEFQGLPAAGSFFFDHTIIMDGTPQYGSLVLAQQDWGSGWNGPRTLLFGTW